jgi:hypothetical protein
MASQRGEGASNLSLLLRMARKILRLRTRRISSGMITEKVSLMYCLYTCIAQKFIHSHNLLTKNSSIQHMHFTRSIIYITQDFTILHYIAITFYLKIAWNCSGRFHFISEYSHFFVSLTFYRPHNVLLFYI